MQISKIFKFYFYFSMAICSVAMIGSTPSLNGYFVSVLNFADDVGQKILKNEANLQTGFVDSTKQKNIPMLENMNLFSREISDLISYKILPPEKNFAYPGDKSINIMDMEFSTNSKNMMIQKMKFKVSGVDDSRIESLSMFIGDEFFAYANNHKGYFEFENINIPLIEKTKLMISFKVDLSFALMGGNRIALDIEKPSDIQFYNGQENVFLKGFFPIKGTNLTVLGFK